MKRIAMRSSSLSVLLSLAQESAGQHTARLRRSAAALQICSRRVRCFIWRRKISRRLLSDWNSSPQKRQWIQSDNYEVFSRSRLFLRLKGASDQFAAAAGLPPDMDFLSQVSGEHSVFALYDIGNLQFLYITYLPSAKAMESTLWQTREKFEPRSAGGVNFYLRRDPESKREVAFAISGDYLLLATREDLMAGALQLMSGKPDRTVESEQWWAQSTAAAGPAGDLRMVLDLGEARSQRIFPHVLGAAEHHRSLAILCRGLGPCSVRRINTARNAC